jgi:hypothetical protein
MLNEREPESTSLIVSTLCLEAKVSMSTNKSA